MRPPGFVAGFLWGGCVFVILAVAFVLAVAPISETGWHDLAVEAGHAEYVPNPETRSFEWRWKECGE